MLADFCIEYLKNGAKTFRDKICCTNDDVIRGVHNDGNLTASRRLENLYQQPHCILQHVCRTHVNLEAMRANLRNMKNKSVYRQILRDLN